MWPWASSWTFVSRLIILWAGLWQAWGWVPPHSMSGGGLGGIQWISALLKFTTLGTDFRIPRSTISLAAEPEFLSYLFLIPNPVTLFIYISASQPHLRKCYRDSIIISDNVAMLLLKSFTMSNLIHLYSYYVFKNTSYKPYGNLEGKREVVGKSNKQCQDFIISVRLGIPNSEVHILTQMPYF